MVIAGWVLAYAWKCAVGILSTAGPQHVAGLWRDFRSNAVEVAAWHGAFVLLVAVISARGLQRGIEAANKVRAPGLLALLLILVVYSLSTGDVRRGLAFAFTPHFSAITAQVVLTAIGQAFVAWLTQRRGVGRTFAVCVVAIAAWVLGLGSVLSFNRWSDWHPLALVPLLADKTFFDVIDYLSANVLLPIGAALTSVLVGWRLDSAFMTDELAETIPAVRVACRWRFWPCLSPRWLDRHSVNDAA
jgi:SNF family Na+-dependent transporter